MFFLGWHEIRQTLYESLPEGVVEFGKKFDRYNDEGDAGVRVHFKVGTARIGVCIQDHRLYSLETYLREVSNLGWLRKP